MNSASKVGEIFTKAGETFHKLADMTVMLDPNAKELLVGGAKVVDVPKKPQQTNGVTRIVMGQDGVMQQAVLQQQQ
jgi:hypothetical protein